MKRIIILRGIKIYAKHDNKTMKKLFSIMSNLQTHYNFKLDFQKIDQHAGGKWLIHGTKHRNDNQLQRLEIPRKISL